MAGTVTTEKIVATSVATTATPAQRDRGSVLSGLHWKSSIVVGSPVVDESVSLI